MGWEGWAVGFGAPGQPFSVVTISEGDNKNSFEARDFEGGVVLALSTSRVCGNAFSGTMTSCRV